jgi:AcrR family transcriptional regulator
MASRKAALRDTFGGRAMTNRKIWEKRRGDMLPIFMARPRGKGRLRKSRATGRGGRHGRTMAFFNSAARRLAWEPYERVSVAMICRDANSSRYTFYHRFPSKPALMYGLVLVTYRELIRDFNRTMAPEAWKDATPQAIVRRLVDEVVASTMTVPTIGVTQLAIQIAMSKPEGAEPYFEFRAAVIDRAIKLLSAKLEIRNAKKFVRIAIQMVLAMATDEAWRHGIPFTTERKRELASEYNNLVLHCLSLPSSWRDAKDVEAVHPLDAEFPEHFQIDYGITKRTLGEYEKVVNQSRKPEFRLDHPVDVENAVILATKAERRKPEKPIKRPHKRRFNLL